MTIIQIEVSDKPYKVQVARENGWGEKVGHIISFEGLQFAAIPLDITQMRITEVSSGTKVFNVFFEPDAGATPDEALEYLTHVVAPDVYKRMMKIGIDDVKKAVKDALVRNKKLGPKPDNVEISVDDVYTMADKKS